MSRLLIIGAGGHGKVVADCAKAMGLYSQIKLLDNAYPDHQGFCDFNVIGRAENFDQFTEETEFFVAIGNNAVRADWQARLRQSGCSIATLIHPSSVIGTGVEIGEGSLVLANAVLNILTKVGRGCIINTSASLDHDCLLGDFVHVAPGVRCAGTVTLCDGVFMGVASAAVPGITIGKHSIVGAGATVIADLLPNITAVGTPAKVIKQNA